MIMIPQSLKILRMKQMSIILIIVLLFSCSSKKATPKEGDGWLKGDNDRKFETISKHFRGFDMAMMEVGYRYTELYWAGQDQNWDYALYQLDKIKLTVENGIERRPKRAHSAKIFLDNSINEMKEAIQQPNKPAFNNGFAIFQTACHSCHISEKVSFIKVDLPKQ